MEEMFKEFDFNEKPEKRITGVNGLPLPEGYVIHNFQTVDTPQGINYICTFSHPEHRNLLHLRYTLHPTEYSVVYPKDDGSEELYKSHGVEHYISSNDGYYRAVWGNDEKIQKILLQSK